MAEKSRALIPQLTVGALHNPNIFLELLKEHPFVISELTCDSKMYRQERSHHHAEPQLLALENDAS